MRRLHYAAIVPAGFLIAMIYFSPACGSELESGKSTPHSTLTAASEETSAVSERTLEQAPASTAGTSATPSPGATASGKSVVREIIKVNEPTIPPKSVKYPRFLGSLRLRFPRSARSAEMAPDPSGKSVPIGNLPGWKQVFYDDFRDETVSDGQFAGCNSSTGICPGLPAAAKSKWWDYPDGWLDTAGTCEYEPSQTISVRGGVMNMFIHTSQNGTCMAAAPAPKLPNSVDGANGQLYGMYSVRMRSDPVPGYLAAFLLWPDSENWPADGEIDFPDGNLDGTVGAFMHHQGATSGTQQDAYLTRKTFTDWHTYTIEWTPIYVKFLIDGKVVGDSTDASQIPDTPMHWVMQTESDLDGPRPAAKAQGNLQIAWAAVWAYNPSTG